jgi:lysophospholipase L1-like esterase
MKFRRARLLRGLRVLLVLLLLLELGLRVAGHFYLNRLYVHVADLSPGDITILCLGESSTEGLGVEPADAYPAQLSALLQARYGHHFSLIIPPDIGQNSSQVADRIGDYLDRYRPSLVIIMEGVNNDWALRESHIARFVQGSDTWRLSAQRAIDGIRLLRLGRYLYLRFTSGAGVRRIARERLAIFGQPGFAKYPPPPEVYAFALQHQEAFRELWRWDVRHIIDGVKRKGAQPLLMTYHTAGSIPVEEFVAMAEEQHTPLVRNDLAFGRLQGAPEDYLIADRWHPNKKGYAVIAKEAFDEITRLNLLGLN